MTAHTEIPKEPDSYVEARLDLIEQMFAQMFAFFPPEAAELMAQEYNQRRTAVIQTFLPGTEFAASMTVQAPAAKPERSLLLVPKHLS